MRSAPQKNRSTNAHRETSEPRGSRPERSTQLRRAALLVAPVLILALAALRLHRSPASASDLEMTPDSVEYAIGAHRFATEGNYEILIDGTLRPPRYPPWFSILLLAPVYFAAPGEIGNGVLAVWVCGVAAVLAAYGIGTRLAGEGGGVGAALALLAVPAFNELSRQIMTDVPALAFGLGGAWLFLRLREGIGARTTADAAGQRLAGSLLPWSAGGDGTAMLAAGLLAAGGYAMRGEAILIVLPFAALLALRAVRGRRSVVPMLALAGPPVILLLATALYNATTFGSVFRTGYHYWCSVPYDYPRLVFSTDYLSMNARSFATRSALFCTGLGIVSAIAFPLRQRISTGADGARSRPAWLDAVLFAALAALPASALHLVYFYANIRFHLLLLALLAILGGAGLGGLLPDAFVRRRWPVWILLGAAFVFPRAADPEPMNRIAAETVARETPAGAVILTGVTPVYLQWFLDRGAPRRVVPVSRSVEYASKLITPRRIPVLDPPPTGPTDHRAPALLRAGAEEAYPIVAAESRERIESWLREGKRVFLDGSVLPGDFARKAFLGQSMTLERVRTYTWLAEVKLRRRPLR